MILHFKMRVMQELVQALFVSQIMQLELLVLKMLIVQLPLTVLLRNVPLFKQLEVHVLLERDQLPLKLMNVDSKDFALIANVLCLFQFLLIQIQVLQIMCLKFLLIEYVLVDLQMQQISKLGSVLLDLPLKLQNKQPLANAKLLSLKLTELLELSLNLMFVVTTLIQTGIALGLQEIPP